jgi:FKBP-type peptidyl-prolyl cis-trans isomerase FkpA
MRFVFSLLVLTVLFSSCAKKKAEEQAAEDKTIIKNYIAANGLFANESASGLHYVIDLPGTGDPCNSLSTVRVAYKGYLTNGTVFDESDAEGITFGLQSVIRGWTEGIPFYKEGGEGILLIPSALGYGTSKVGSIPANSVLIFDIKLIEVL